VQPAKLDQIAAGQHGLFTRGQARGCGYSSYQVRRRVASAEWVAVLGPVLVRAGVPLTPALYDVAASLAVPGGVLAGPSAARMHGMPVRESGQFVAIGAPGRRAVPGVRFLRDPLPGSDVVTIGGISVTGRSRTVFDCVRVLTDGPAIELLDRALREHWIGWEEFTARVRSFAGRHGAPRLAALTGVAGVHTRSRAGHLAVDLLRGAHLTGWSASIGLRDRRAGTGGASEIVFRQERLVIQILPPARAVVPAAGPRPGTDPPGAGTGGRRHGTGPGWTVLRFDLRDLTDDPQGVVTSIRAALRKVRDPPGPYELSER